jgi:hypothetical protein
MNLILLSFSAYLTQYVMKHKHLHATLFLIILTATSFAQRVVPLWRYKNDRLGRHFYTVIQKEIGPNEQKQGWEFEGPACWVYTSSVRGSVAFNRFVNNSTGDHFYSLHLSPSEAPPGYIYEGPACTINADKVYDRQVPLWEYYKPSSGEHFYTIQLVVFLIMSCVDLYIEPSRMTLIVIL